MIAAAETFTHEVEYLMEEGDDANVSD